MSKTVSRTHEITFCARVKSWAEALFAEHTDWPFVHVEIEESKSLKRKRSDLRIYGKADKLIVSGEVKLPGTREGRSPYALALLDDANAKADNAGAEFFFTWNVNALVLFDRKRWNLPLPERRVKEFPLGEDLQEPEDVGRPEVERKIREFLAGVFSELASIIAGEKPQWGMSLDEWFIRAFESHISWPVRLAVDHMAAASGSDRSFDLRLQEWLGREQGWLFARNDPRQWRDTLDRAARTLCYVFANRLLFYESVCAKFPELQPLDIPQDCHSPTDLCRWFQKAFQHAVEATGDYETLFYPQERDWAGPLIFSHPDAAEAWRSVIQNLEPFNFKLIPTDILGGIFRRLIDPEERHKFGQHYTNEDLVDVVNSFCIRQAEDAVLDPACGSGSFLVRAYHRKAWLPSKPRGGHGALTHLSRLADIYGVDLSFFAAHLSTVNLAARDIRDVENYPRIRRGNFFEVAHDLDGHKPFCLVPEGPERHRQLSPVHLTKVDAVVGNPPYVRQELIPRRGQAGVKPFQAKEDMVDLCTRFWTGCKLSGRSDLHCFFWPAAARFLSEGGWLGFLVSSSWLDVEYGFALQEWILGNFRLHAILESTAEPWFEDARVKTCAVILQRCSDQKTRMAQLVKFVRLDAPLRSILGERPDENARQTAADRFRDALLASAKTATQPNWRVVVVRQEELWKEGVRAGRLFDEQRQRDADGTAVMHDSGDDDYGGSSSVTCEPAAAALHEARAAYGGRYGGGKWGKYLRAPDFYFRIMERYGARFVPLGEIVAVRRGITSGCDAFFMPRNVSALYLEKYSAATWNDAPLYTHCKRADVVSGRMKLIQAGDTTVHPVEAQYLAPEVHSLMNVSKPVIRTNEVDRLVLQVSVPMDKLKGTLVQKYLRYGEKTTFASKKSRSVPVSRRSTCATRPLWYDLTGLKPGVFFWPKAQQYRHVIPTNPDSLICNCNLYDVHPMSLAETDVEVLKAVVNSTLVANFKSFYGRYAGTEGNLKTEIVDVNLLEIPDPRRAPRSVVRKLVTAFAELSRRDTQPLVEGSFMECHSYERALKLAEEPVGLPLELCMADRRALDLTVFELIGVKSAAEREALCDELYRETSLHFRRIRVVEIQKQEQRAEALDREFRTDELAADIWDGLLGDERVPPQHWLAGLTADGCQFVIPDGVPSIPDATDMFEANILSFRTKTAQGARSERVELPSRAHAEMLFRLAEVGVRGPVTLPRTDASALQLNNQLAHRLSSYSHRVIELALSRTGDEQKAREVADLLEHWLVHGR